MLPILVICAVVLLQLCTTSPVYNMQPAYITTNISSMGRNIRNLPCISRKTNQSGVCMFAIDCLKANGTHLGTCIDRFYFGSCCHVEPPSHDIIENTIEGDIIPAREPPERLSGTIKPILNHTSTTTTTTPSSTTQTPKQEPTTIGFKLSTFQTVEEQNTSASTTSTTTIKSTTTKKQTTVTNKTTRRPTTTTTRPTRRPTTRPTRRPISTKPSTIVTKKPTSVKPTKKVTTATKTTSPRPSTSTTFSTILTKRPSTRPSTTATPISSTVTEFVTNVTLSLVNKTSVNGIEGSTTQGTIVTWTALSEEKTTTSSVQPGNSTSEEWVPIATPDNWVPLPSVLPSSSTLAWEPNKTVSTTPAGTTTTESASKTSVTYIPLETSTASSTTLNNATVTHKPAVEVTSTGTTAPPSQFSTSTGSSTGTSTSTGTQAPPSTTSEGDFKPVNMSDFTDVCGRRMFPEARIVGGEKSSFGKWPWQISLRQWRTSTYLHKCGAALLNENWAITAAHCVDNVPPSDLLLRLGEHDLSTESEPYLHQERRVQIVASHPQFDPRTFEYDIALLRFYEPVTFQPNILPVCVPQTNENFVGRTAYVTGWGRLYEDGPLPSVLQEVSVPVINNSVCESMYRSAGYIEHIPHIFICAGWRRGGFDSCEGDSGGPMVIQREDKRFLLAGVISWGIGCAEPNQPGVYTRISEFRDWINQILQF